MEGAEFICCVHTGEAEDGLFSSGVVGYLYIYIGYSNGVGVDYEKD